jgi:Tuberculosis necrotizing toxin
MATQIAGVSPATTIASAPPRQTDPKAEAARILAETRIGTGDNAGHRVDFIEVKLDKIADMDRAFAAAVRAEVVKTLSLTDQGRMERDALAQIEQDIWRDAGNGQALPYSTTSRHTQDQWITQARANNYPDLRVYEILAGANDNGSIKRAMDAVFNGTIPPSQLNDARAAVAEKSWTENVGDFLASVSPTGRILEAAQPAIAALGRNAGLGRTEWGASLQRILDTPGTMQAFNAGVATGMVEGAKAIVVDVGTAAGRIVQFGADNSLLGVAGDAARRLVPDSVKGWLNDVGIGGALNQIAPSAQRGQESADSISRTAGAVADYFATRTPSQVATDVKNRISGMWESVKGDHARAAAQGPEAEARWWGTLTGRVTFEVAATFIPVAGQIGKGARVAGAIETVTDAVRVDDRVAHGVRVGGKLDEVGKIAETLLSRGRRILGDLPLNQENLAQLYKAGRLTMDEARVLAKSVDWRDATGWWIYPPNDGFNTIPRPAILRAGDNITIDRYGSPRGSFASPVGESKAARALPKDTDFSPTNYHVYKVAEDVEVLAGKATPWFDQAGGAVQFKLASRIQDLLDDGRLIEVGKQK